MLASEPFDLGEENEKPSYLDDLVSPTIGTSKLGSKQTENEIGENI